MVSNYKTSAKRLRKDKMTQRDDGHNNEWQWDSVKIELTNPNGETIKLNSGDFSDWFMEQCFQELQDYVKEKKGVLKK